MCPESTSGPQDALLTARSVLAGDVHPNANAMSSCVAFGSLTILTYGDSHCEAFARANCTVCF